MDNSTHEEHLSQPFQTNKKQFKVAVTFLTVYNGIFNVTDKNNQFYLKKSITERDGFIHITIPSGAYEIENLNNEIKRIDIDKGHFNTADYLFKIKPKFTTFGSYRNFSTRFWDFTKLYYTENIIYHIKELIFYHLTIFFLNAILLKG